MKNERTLQTIEIVCGKLREFCKENNLYIHNLNGKRMPQTFGNDSGGTHFSLEFSAYNDDEPYKSIPDYSEPTAVSTDT
jgi:hypothetical protein